MADGTLFGPLNQPVVIDLFCGAGGSSTGFKMVTGRSPTAAINHWDYAIRTHELNHPDTLHFQEDIFHVEPWKAARGRQVDLLFGSPSCTHFSVAKGKAPLDAGIRSQAEVFIKWAHEIRPRIIILENVAEFLTYGPIDEQGYPIKARAGEYFRAWVQALEQEGYQVAWKVLRACDFGAPTSRKRLFVVARRDGIAPAFPLPTHGGSGQPGYRTAAEIIDWSIPCPSIFDRKRPLADATLRRIAAGVHKFVLNNANPFILCLSHGGRLEPITDPLRTITTAKRGERALVASTLVQVGYGERDGQAPRALDIQKPLGTVVSGASKVGLVSAFLAKHYTGVVGTPLEQPIGTVTTADHHSLVAASLTKFYSSSAHGAPITTPLPTVTATGQHAGLVAAFLTKFYGAEGQNQPVDRPMDTATVKARFGLVTVEIQGETYAVVDIGMRMLEPRELARAQGFPDSYRFEGSKADQIAAIGNAVVPQVMAALVAANLGGAL
jgi:DNA (cytosine-5)-methyltransferase 1